MHHTYIYKDPIKDLGMRKIKIPRRILHKVYPNNNHYKLTFKFIMFQHMEYYIDQDNMKITEMILVKPYVPFIAWILFPLFILLNGITNTKEIVNEIMDMHYQKKRGKFLREVMTRNHNKNGYYAILSYLGIPYTEVV